MKRSLRWSILVSLGAALLVSLVPAAIILDRRLARELEEKARRDLALAPRLLEDRNVAQGDVLMMHARELASTDGLGVALNDPDEETAQRLLAMAPTHSGETPVLVDGQGVIRDGVPPGVELIERTKADESPAGFVAHEGEIHLVSVAPVMAGDDWVGAVGVSVPIDDAAAGTLSGLTGSDVVIVRSDGSVVVATLETGSAEALARLALGAEETARAAAGPPVLEVNAAGIGRHWVIVAPLGTAARIVFARSAERELAILPRLRRGGLAAGGLALGLALLVGGLLAAAVARPVRSLAHAADRLAKGDFETPLPSSSVVEVDRMATAFDDMRHALASRLEELQAANLELADRQERLRVLQGEIVQRDRMVASGRLLAELAHEIRNPVANVRNCLEVLRRGTEDRPDLQEFSDLAIDELLRMHELAEQMLELNRPLDPEATACDARQVAETVASLFGARLPGEGGEVRVAGAAAVPASIAPDALKQVLMNLVQNAGPERAGGDGLRRDHRDPRRIGGGRGDGGGSRSGRWDRGGGPRQNLRSLLHHEGGGAGNRPGPLPGGGDGATIRGTTERSQS